MGAKSGDFAQQLIIKNEADEVIIYFNPSK